MRLHHILIGSLAASLALVAGCDKYAEPEGTLAETHAWDAAHPDLALRAVATAPPVPDTNYDQAPSGPGTPSIVTSPEQLSRYAISGIEGKPVAPATTPAQQPETK